MTTNLNAWLKSSVNIREYGNTRSQELRKQLVCNDGTTLSVQASDSHWCSPEAVMLMTTQTILNSLITILLKSGA